jgi:hypothetical protein
LHTPCRFMLPKKLLINCVDRSKIIHVLHEDLYSTRQDHFEQVEQKVDTRTVVLMIFPAWLPLASIILFKFWSA